MASPSTTKGAAGNVIAASTALGAGATSTAVDLDYSTDFCAYVEFLATAGGTVSATAGVEVKCYKGTGSSAVYETQPTIDVVIPVTTASTTTSMTLTLDNGQWQVTLKNLDVTNGVTIEATSDVVGSIA